jgi:hypothetical protein
MAVRRAPLAVFASLNAENLKGSPDFALPRCNLAANGLERTRQPVDQNSTIVTATDHYQTDVLIGMKPSPIGAGLDLSADRTIDRRLLPVPAASMRTRWTAVRAPSPTTP